MLPDTPVDTEPGGAGTDPEYAGAVNVGGFLVSESGMICGIADVDTAVVDGYVGLPSEGCSGIARGAFAGVAAEISEVYIPANITYAEEGAFLWNRRHALVRDGGFRRFAFCFGRSTLLRTAVPVCWHFPPEEWASFYCRHM